MRKIITTAVVTLAAFAASPAPASADYCAEDEPCFNWTQDGNGARGVVLTNGKTIVVTPCQFSERWYGVDGAGRRIDRKATPKLKGDRWARLKGCGYDVRSF